MGRCKELWMQQCEDLVDKYAAGIYDREYAYTHLVAMGLDPHEANNQLDHARPTDVLTQS